MVHRQLTLAAGVAAALAAAVPAHAANAKIAIGDFRWSRSQVNIELGEHVTWYWAGPDLQHSVTGNGLNDADVDSDADRNVPEHRVGDTFRVTFDQPGTYDFHCKLHPTVAGTIVVSPVPGDPDAEPDPDPVLRPDRTLPSIAGLRARQQGEALRVRYTLDKQATVTALLRRRGRLVRTQLLPGHVGYDDSRIDVSRLPAGRYALRMTPTDTLGNVGATVRQGIRLSSAGRR